MYVDLFNKINESKHLWKNEEELRIGWISALSHFLEINLEAERDRNDSSYNNVIIEFKSPGLFKGKINSRAFLEAINERLKPYIQKKAKIEGLDEADYIGIAVDGEHICFTQLKEGVITHGELLPFSIESVTMVATALKDSIRRAITIENLVVDFGVSSKSGISLMKALAEALSNKILDPNNNKIKMLFEEWRTLFGQVADLSKTQREGIKKSISFIISQEIEEQIQIPASLFVIHTYNSIVIKFLAAEIVSSHKLTSTKDFAQSSSTLADERLLKYLENELERGRLFEAAGINGFVEEAIFGWYLDACQFREHREAILTALRNTLIKLSFYRTDSLSEARTQDVLKGFYQSLVPTELRKSLGEYYTPDWLVDFSINKIPNIALLEHRFLDPTCGSASFLLGLIRRIRREAESYNLSPDKTLDIITKNVWGFDLNPLAVQTARVNYLIAISDLLHEAKGKEIEIPVLMADAIYSPSIEKGNEEKIVTYSIGSPIADLNVQIPSALAFNRERIDISFKIMGDLVEKDVEYDRVNEQLIKAKVMTEAESKEWESPLKLTYNKILELHKKNWNGIWFRIVRNFFWSANAGEFDAIVGNPPWVRWSNLPELYRERVKTTCLEYDIFSSTPHHGGNELDISGMVTYTVADKWLKENGYLVFLLPQTHFQAPSSEGFRSFSINPKMKLNPISVDDMKALKPFQDAVNKTAVVLFKKGNSEVTYPVEYLLWKAKEGLKKAIPSHFTLEEAREHIFSTLMEAIPVGNSRSPWAILPPGRFNDMKLISGKSEWINGKKGITTDLNGIYFVKILDVNEKNNLVQIETRPEAGKKDIGVKKKYWIEADMLYPLIKGAGDFSKYNVSPKENLYAIVPNKGITKEHFEEIDNLFLRSCLKTAKYFEDYKDILVQRSTWKRYLKDKPYYGIYNVGSYSFAPYKVIWAEQANSFSSAVVESKDVPIVGRRSYVADHKLYFVDFYKAEPAYYLCGLLNSRLVKEFIESHSISIQVSNIFKYLKIPEFNEEITSHLNLAKLAKQAHMNGINTELEEKIEKLVSSILGEQY